VLEAADPYVHLGEASAIVKVKFRLVVFRPFVGEILEGTVRSSSEEGIHVSVSLFDDILVPPACMQSNTTFDPSEQVWSWNYEENQMFLDVGETIRFRVMGEQFTETAPLQKEVLMAARAAALSDTEVTPVEEEVPVTPAPYKLVATVAEDGLGLVRWWQPPE
jgi:DNA-directed RNA polymerase III subunit RPC8